MIKKDKNKLKLETKSKILVLGLILIILVGLFSPMMQVNAEDLGTCTFVQQGGRFNGQTFTRTETRATCEGRVRSLEPIAVIQ
ncbi:MAG: hypothetical protein US45_C0004G0019 [Candidatus Nomurabacteria bacterium GW2011_GWA1_37_20]|uniref:Uncharacterized protein n=1 Tax=Candidatus Nomurabacteria bacterium GW2011_GWA1_37_20 TaxID=1618729 RepID=A0A0G0GS12_9BACT|nr:MAG: hypothetical protein US45_C0004G0019 [Candidatus Nomurabacteria bacterium GW2011_GWA1_37_20]